MDTLPSPEDFRVLRAKLNQTQGEMAARFGVDQATYARWEQGALPRNLRQIGIIFAQIANPPKSGKSDSPKPDGRTERARINREADLRRFMDREKAQADREGKDFIPFLEAKFVVNSRIAANPIKSIAREARGMVDYLREALRLLGAEPPSFDELREREPARGVDSVPPTAEISALLAKAEPMDDVARELEIEREKRALLLEKLDNPEEFP